MERIIRIEDWDAQRPARLELARKIGFVRRSPLGQQITKSKAKKALLRAMYGPYGQPFSQPEAPPDCGSKSE